MPMKQLVRMMEIGKSVAEFDQSLDKYFVETETFRALVGGQVDIIAGDKGTGKTALYRILKKRYAQIPELANVEVLSGFNPSGNPIFQRIAQQNVLTEGQYITVWKAYLLSLIGNWLLELYDGAFTGTLEQLDRLLRTTDLRSVDDTPVTVFSRISNTVSRFLNPKSAEVAMTLSETGIPIVTPRVEFGEGAPRVSEVAEVRHEDALGLLNRALTESEIDAWVVLDRLDEAFVGFPETEVPALRALLRTYLDLLEFERIKLKLFVRNDLFRKIVRGGFVNLTHVNARKIEIVWDEEDLMSLLCRRIRDNEELVDRLSAGNISDEELFYRVFPQQVEVGERKPTTWVWMMGRIRDGNNLKPPRNLIDLVSKARESQLRREERSGREFEEDLPLVEADSIKRALSRLSEERVQDTLLAEVGDLQPTIERFRGGKAEHNVDTLARILGIGAGEVYTAIRPLVDLGFLESVGENYKIPMLYRDGLEITQGKAF